MKKELSPEDIERRAAKRARRIQKEVLAIEKAGIKSQKTGQMTFNRLGEHGVIYQRK